MIDLGCGEGSHLSNISDMLRFNYNKVVNNVGIDISKEGIFVAAKNYSDTIWAVGDLANPPFYDGQFDVILNILSPSNYAEFNRLLKSDGLVVKIIPQSDYLKELREILFDEPEKQVYSNVETLKIFNENFEIVNSSRLYYTQYLNNSAIQLLAKMTPLTWSTTEDKIKLLLERNSLEATVDLHVLIGKKR
ncbi:methyltransferase domain-containing protein (plasmid) [Bacillus sp. N447-1]|nr:methyltransferase domain-containing protein [Bacillus sp. N447-1]